MSAVGTHGMNLIPDLGKEDLASLDSLHLNLLLLTILQVDAGQALELVFGSHGSDACRESCLVDMLKSWCLSRYGTKS